MSPETASEIAFMAKVTTLGMEMAKQQTSVALSPVNKAFLHDLMFTHKWAVEMERPYRWVLSAPAGDRFVFDQKHHALNITCHPNPNIQTNSS